MAKKRKFREQPQRATQETCEHDNEALITFLSSSITSDMRQQLKYNNKYLWQHLLKPIIA